MSDDSNEHDWINKIADVQGVACLTVSDGHVLLFKRSCLQSIMDQNPDKEKILIFIKRPDFKIPNKSN